MTRLLVEFDDSDAECNTERLCAELERLGFHAVQVLGPVAILEHWAEHHVEISDFYSTTLALLEEFRNWCAGQGLGEVDVSPADLRRALEREGVEPIEVDCSDPMYKAVTIDWLQEQTQRKRARR